MNFTVSAKATDFRRFDIIKTQSTSKTGIVLSYKSGHVFGYGTITVRPYKVPKNKWLRKLKLWFFKLFLKLNWIK